MTARTRHAFALLIGMYALGCAATLWAAPGDRVFVARGARFEAPQDLFPPGEMLPTPNGTSVVETADHALVLVLGSIPAPQGGEAAALKAEFAKRSKAPSASYKTAKPDFFVVSGKTKDARDRDSIYYVRGIRGPQSVLILKAVYLDNQKARLNSIVAAIMKSFAPLAEDRCGETAMNMLWDLPETAKVIDGMGKTEPHQNLVTDLDPRDAMDYPENRAVSTCEFDLVGKYPDGGRLHGAYLRVVPETKRVWIQDEDCDVFVPLDQWRAGKHGNKKACYEPEPGPSMDLMETGLD